MNQLSKICPVINRIKKIFWSMRLCVFISFLLSFSLMATSIDNNFKVLLSAEMLQQITITGTVTEKGEPMPGVNVLIKGTIHGIVTDANGKYSIMAPNRDVILVFSFVGYTTTEMPVGDRREINVVLTEDTHEIEEVVVVGYGTQKKVNLTGAVSTVDVGKMTESRPITSLSAGLSGMAPGVFVTQGNGGLPGKDDATLRIRGQGTLNDSDPLTVIDGVIGSMNDINPQDVESISILKDAASSAIYGSRAANGVVLITTRKGRQGTAKISYSGYVASENIHNSIGVISNYADYMELMNEGYQNSGITPKFSQAKIDEWRNAGNSDPLKYPNTDWQDELFTQGWMQNHTLSVSGGTEKIRYFLSGNYMNNPGIMENSAYERISARANFDVDVKSWFTVGVNAYGYRGSYEMGTDAMEDMFIYAPSATPGIVYRSPDGRFGGTNNPEDDPGASSTLMILYKYKGDIIRNKLVSRFFGILRPFKGFSIEGSYTYDYSDTYKYRQPVFNDVWDFYNNTIKIKGEGKTWVSNKDEKWFKNQMDAIARYEINVSRMNIQLLAGANQESYKYQWFEGSKEALIAPELTELDAATLNATTAGNYTNWAMRSFFGRLNLNWDEKYLLEANLRSDGSSRFAPEYRWGYFPSFSVGWRISEEGFIQGLNWLDNLKIRASWGALGNNSIGNYDYISYYDDNSYILNNELSVGFAQKALSNAIVTWESTYVTNFGFDFAVFRSRLNGSIDLFDKDTKNILIDLPAPLVHGTTSIPKQNAARVRNRGFEIDLSWNDRAGNVGYFVRGNLTYTKNKVIKFKGDEPAIDGTNMILEGEPINIQYILSADRIVQTDEDLAVVQAMVDKEPDAFASYKRPEKGDLLYKDTNGDGKVNDDDRIKVGNGNNPIFAFGFSFGANWKGIDFSCLLQGTAGHKSFWINRAYQPLVRYGNSIGQEIAEGRWHEGRTDAWFPRLLESSDGRNTLPSDFWLFNRSYLRVKNIQLGYTFPKNISQKLLLETLRFYGSIDNALTFTKFPGLDPESGGMNYPTIRLITLGVNLTF